MTTQGVVGYVLKAYPRMSELFILSEIHRLENQGLPLRVFAIKAAEENDREPRHPVVDRIRVDVEFLPVVTSLSRSTPWRWFWANWRAFRGAVARVALRRPLGLARATGAAAAQALRSRRSGHNAGVYLRDFLRAVDVADRMTTTPQLTHLHAHYAHDATTVTWLASMITGVPFSFTAHARDLYCEDLNPAGLLRRKLKASSFAVTCTEANRIFLQNVDPSRPVHKLYHGLNADFARLARPAATERGAPSPFRIIGVGRLVAKKGFDVLIRAAALLRDGGRPIELVIAGPDGDASETLRSLVRELGLEHAVRFAGPLSQMQLAQEYRTTDAFCLPCRILEDGDRDGIPNVLMEAMAAGIPVVTTPVCGIPELVAHEATGLLTPPDDPDALAAVIERLVSDRRLGQRLAERGRARILSEFDGDRLAARLASLFSQATATGDRPSLPGLVRVFAPELGLEARPLVGSYALALLAILAWTATPWPLKLLIDSVVEHKALPSVLRGLAGATPSFLVAALSAAFLGATIVAAACAAWERRVTSRMRERLGIAIRGRLLGHLATLPPTLRIGHRGGELVFRLVGDVDVLVRLFTKTLPLLFRYTATAIVMCAAMLWISPAVGMATLVLLPVLLAVARRHGVHLAEASRRKRKREGQVAAFAQEIVRGLPVIQALGADRWAQARFGQINARSLKAGVKESYITARMERDLEIARGLAVAVVTGGGAIFALSGRLTVGALTVLASYIAQVLKPVDKINDLAEATSRGLAAGGRLLALLSQRPAVQDRPDAIELARCDGLIELSHVSFAYPSAAGVSPFVLEDINLRLEPGKLTVLLGRSGAGKSTLTSLLVRHFNPTAGEIRLDGVAYRDVKLRSLRNQIAIMSQDLHLFSGSLRDAITPDIVAPDDARLWEVLGFVALDEFVRSLPGGLDAPLVEDASNLSGGQRQRLSLARAILMDRPILLLDEPLANVDAVSAGVILKALEKLRRNRTCLAITHETTLVGHADVILRLESGRLVEERRVTQFHVVEARA